MLELGLAPLLELLKGLVLGQAEGVEALGERARLAGLQLDLGQIHAVKREGREGGKEEELVDVCGMRCLFEKEREEDGEGRSR